MSHREKELEDSVRSGLHPAIKLIGSAVIMWLVAVPPLWACIQAGNILGIFLCLILASIVGKIVWRVI